MLASIVSVHEPVAHWRESRLSAYLKSLKFAALEYLRIYLQFQPASPGCTLSQSLLNSAYCFGR